MLSEPDIEDGEDVATAAHVLLRAAGLRGPVALAPLTHGGNNRVTRVDCGAQAYVLKRYFRHALDPRDRFAADTSFSEFLWSAGVRDIPKLIAAERTLGAALFAFVDGSPVSSPVVASHVAQALDFIEAVNKARESDAAANLPVGAEACFTIAEHLELVDRRVSALTSADTVAGRFARDELQSAWRAIRTDVISHAERELDRTLHRRDCCLSPSDFGFHNAIIRPDGTLVFHDFEYAGWDDPAKLICDFFCQVQVPVPSAYLPGSVERVADCLGAAGWLEQRVRWLLPVYRVKWCCILLGAATPSGSARRRFAGRPALNDAEVGRQLERARELLRLAGQ